jgi:hypothetical protein
MIPHVPLRSLLRQEEEAARRRTEEECAMYSAEDLAAGWEFKILRCYLSVFHKPAYFHRVLTEEARAGWELVEALDASRLRFKRLAARRSRDAELPAGYNPYRLRVGPSAWTVAMWSLAAIPSLIGMLILFFNLLALGWKQWDEQMTSMLKTGGAFLGVACALALLGGRPKW